MFYKTLYFLSICEHFDFDLFFIVSIVSCTLSISSSISLNFLVHSLCNFSRPSSPQFAGIFHLKSDFSNNFLRCYCNDMIRKILWEGNRIELGQLCQSNFTFIASRRYIKDCLQRYVATDNTFLYLSYSAYFGSS